jgi:thiamine-phosphate diphosphorylase
VRLPARPVFCLVTSLKHASEPDASRAVDRLVGRIRHAAEAGVTLVQIREPLLDASVLHALVSRSVDAVKGTSCRVVVNDRMDVALAARAHGVHLRGDSYAPARVRAAWPDALIGCSVHSAGEAARRAAAGGADYIVFGTVFGSDSKPPEHPVAGVDALAEVVRTTAPLPVLAIGGVNLERAASVAATGAAGIAAITLFAGSAGDDPPLHGIVRGLRETFENSATLAADNIPRLPSGRNHT